MRLNRGQKESSYVKATLRVDLDLCQGHGQCQEAAAEFFEVRDDGFAHVLRDVSTEEELAKVREAQFRCPVDAVEIVEA